MYNSLAKSIRDKIAGSESLQLYYDGERRDLHNTKR